MSVSKSIRFDDQKDIFTFTVSSSCENELLSKVDEHKKNGFELVLIYNDGDKKRFRPCKKYFAKMQRKNGKVII